MARVYLGNIPYKTTVADVIELLDQEGVFHEELEVRLPLRSGRPVFVEASKFCNDGYAVILCDNYDVDRLVERLDALMWQEHSLVCKPFQPEAA